MIDARGSNVTTTEISSPPLMKKLARYYGSFDKIPDEIVIQILCFCRYKQILRFAATCKRYHNIIKNSASLQLHIELGVNGLEIIQESRNTTHLVLLSELVRYRDAWLNLKLERPTEQTSMEQIRIALWERREGSYATAFSSTSSFLSAPDSLQMLIIGHLDTPNLVTFPIEFEEFTFHLKQDLAALVKPDLNNGSCLEVRLCSATTGLDHPLAQSPAFIVQVGFSITDLVLDREIFSLEIMENILVVRVIDLVNWKYEILALDWKAGTLLSRIQSNSGIADFSFIDRTRLAVFSVENVGNDPCLITLSLYSIPTYACSGTTASSYFCVSNHACAQPILTFKFPELDPVYRVQSRGLFIRSACLPGRTSYSNSSAFGHSNPLILSATLSLNSADSTHTCSPGDCNCFIHLRIFISVGYLLETMDAANTTIINWTDWGIHNTRWFLDDHKIYDWIHWAYASRFVNVKERPGSALHDLSLFDFHPPTVRREMRYPLSTQTTPEYEESLRSTVLQGKGLTAPHPSNSDLSPNTSLPRLVTEIVDSNMPTFINRGFSVPVESRLPYRVVTRLGFVPKCDEWHIDGSRIIGMNPLQNESDGFDKMLIYKLQV
ncbi:unnamed protein product [Rhizoctonia solani]|uniref:F-box domain-containing protein n=1 Tax=Rhizoctonia solani TaxID=456999 RepID=A0A8H3HJL0_9AGAM|nr:unnamed protein product [Rhizoctonia solani]